jgi:hypothetical protein
MGIVSRIGHWLDTRFPEKISADAVLMHLADMNGKLASIDAQVAEIGALKLRIVDLEKKAETQISEMNKAKVAVMSLRPQAGPYPHR